MKNKTIKIIYAILSILFVVPSINYLMKNMTVEGFNIYYNFFINKEINKIISTTIYLIIFIAMLVIYLKMIKQKFESEKQLIRYIIIISAIFIIMLPWTSSDIFYYMGVGELDSRYNQNPYYITIKEYCNQNIENNNVKDTILEQGKIGYWSDTTVVYGPIAQLIFKICTLISIKNVNISLIIFKIINLIIHIANCHFIYKLIKKKKFVLIYGLNPFILLEFIGNVHNDIIVVFFILLTIYYLKKEKIIKSLLFLALGTGIKYFTILLLPVVIIYHFRNEKKLSIRFLRCFQYGIIFLLFIIAEYILYFRDFSVLTAVLAQTDKYCKSIYSVILQEDKTVMTRIKNILTLAFIMYYLKFVIDIITEKNIKLSKTMKKYNIAIILFLITLTTFQQWYLVWLFATIMWQKSYTIKNILALTSISEIANSVYMFYSEHYKYDKYFILSIIALMLIWNVCKLLQNKLKKREGDNYYLKFYKGK